MDGGPNPPRVNELEANFPRGAFFARRFFLERNAVKN